MRVQKKKSNVRHQAHILQVRCDISGPMSISATAATGEVSGGTHTGCHCVPPLLPQPLIDTVILIQQHLHVSTCFIPPQAGTDIIFIRPLKGNRKNKIASSDLFAFFTPTSSLLERNVFLFFLAAQNPHCSSREFAFPWFDSKRRMDQWLLEPENKVISVLILVLVAVGGTEINRELQSQRSERAQLVLQCSQAAEPLCGTGMCRACLFLG